MKKLMTLLGLGAVLAATPVLAEEVVSVEQSTINGAINSLANPKRKTGARKLLKAIFYSNLQILQNQEAARLRDEAFALDLDEISLKVGYDGHLADTLEQIQKQRLNINFNNEYHITQDNNQVTVVENENDLDNDTEVDNGSNSSSGSGSSATGGSGGSSSSNSDADGGTANGNGGDADAGAGADADARGGSSRSESDLF
ncbi:hypothetical protein [Cognatishimia sp.]|uniref:hypothetical protein n=1 Tax=Cognatishimia sp. TaxID=2211648 RepID=UPI0035153F45|nr:hypothetical protein [Cognatishimia sp.]